MPSPIAFSFCRTLVRSLWKCLPEIKTEILTKGKEGTKVVYEASLGLNNATETLHPVITKQNNFMRATSALFRGLAGRCAGTSTRFAAVKRMAAGRNGALPGQASVSPLLGLLGLTYMMKTTHEEKFADELHGGLQEILKSKLVSVESMDQEEEHSCFKLNDYEIGERLGERSSHSAVYSATCGSSEVAIKMLFNYHVNSESHSLYRAFAKECQVLSNKSLSYQDSGLTSLPPHDNIVKLVHSFADTMPSLPDAAATYPSALPTAMHTQGLGHNRTLFLVMPKYTGTLRQYMEAFGQCISPRTSTLLFAQLLEGVAHMNEYGIAHRDLKSDNILLDEGVAGCPRLVITDFGCCLADTHLGLEMPFVTFETDRGGNRSLMAPEVVKAVPGPDVIIDYSKSDAWAAGTLAYEIHGQENPFYHSGTDSTTYEEGDLPPLKGTQPLVAKVVSLLLKADSEERISAAQAVTMVNLILWAPTTWLVNDCIKFKDIASWLTAQTLDTLIHERPTKIGSSPCPVENEVFLNFLKNTSIRDIMEALNILHKD